LYIGSHESDGVEDVDEESEDLSVEVRGEERSERSEEDHDRDATGKVLPSFGICASHHQVTPEESWNR
jgi:hypothetical protein